MQTGCFQVHRSEMIPVNVEELFCREPGIHDRRQCMAIDVQVDPGDLWVLLGFGKIVEHTIDFLFLIHGG